MTENGSYNSTDDRRARDASPSSSTTGAIAGGAFRSVYRALSDAEKDLVDRVKVKAEEFYGLIAEAGGTDPASDRPGSASLTLAFRHLEDAVYRTVKHITGPVAPATPTAVAASPPLDARVPGVANDESHQNAAAA